MWTAPHRSTLGCWWGLANCEFRGADDVTFSSVEAKRFWTALGLCSITLKMPLSVYLRLRITFAPYLLHLSTGSCTFRSSFYTPFFIDELSTRLTSLPSVSVKHFKTLQQHLLFNLGQKKARMTTASTKILLYTAKVCPYAARAELALALAGVAHEKFEVDLLNKPDWYAERINKASKGAFQFLPPFLPQPFTF